MSMIGKTLAHYEITSQLGKGGMGEVYQAKDRKLGRDVAIKVLPDEFAKDNDRVSRFQREAKLLASLNHPNIAAIYGLEESSGTNFLVLELVEGDTLADRIKAGPIPVEESLKLALQIAEALEAAHEKGVVHRDLKPANIKVTPDGKVKVLDFGLAKAFSGEQSELNLSNSPTLSDMATQQGIILGTAAYMSPEQARGKAVDKRTDIWAFGCVLYEMLTGQAAFQGEDVTEILAAVVKSGADLDLLPANLHPRVREVITRCLQKEQKKRYPDISEAQYEIQKVLSDPSGVFVQPAAMTKARKKLRLGLPGIAVAVVLTAIIIAIAVWNLKPAPPREPRHVARFYYEPPEGQQYGNLTERVMAISPDGSKLVYKTVKGLFLRSIDELNARLVSGTEDNPQKPFFSPDGQWIGYVSEKDRKLKKISVNGGAPVTIADISSTGFLSWGPDDRIVYAGGEGVMRVSANGGKPEVIVTDKEEGHIAPQILPDGKTVMFTAGGAGSFRIVLQSLESGKRKELIPGDTAQYLPTGHIVYGVNDNLFAVPFDLNKLEMKGGPVPIVESVLRGGGAPQYAVSESGTLVYIPMPAGTDAATGNTLVWVSRNGKEEPLTAPHKTYFHPRISPDGTRVAVCSIEGTAPDTYILNLARGTMTRLTFDPAEEDFPLWTPDGKRIAFFPYRKENAGIKLKSADGTGSEDLIMPLKGNVSDFPGAWSADGKTLLAEEFDGNIFSIGAVSMEAEHKWKSLVQGKFGYVQPRISPNGRWLAYTSNESGRNEIYVRPYPEVDSGKWQVSISGGNSALWSPDGRELFYRNGNECMAVSVSINPAFTMQSPKMLFRGIYREANFINGSLELSPWDISPDGKRFLMIKEPGSDESKGELFRPKIDVVLNWFEELKQRVPVK